MPATEVERHELYELVKHGVGDRFTELMIKSLPPEPDRLATKDDVALVNRDLAIVESRLRAEMTETKSDLLDRIHTEITASTRTIVLALVGSVTLMAITNVLSIVLTR